MSSRSKIWILGAATLVLVQAAASLVLAQSFKLIALSDLTQFALLLSGMLAVGTNVIATRGRTRLFWALMTLGMAFWLGYQLLWTYFEVFLGRDVPNPFVGDVVLFVHIVPMIAALALQPHAKQHDRATRLGTLDFTLLLVWWLYLYLFAVIPWQYAQTNETIYEHNLNITYLTEKIVFLIGLAMIWWRSQGAWRRIYAQWFGAGLAYALSSYVANWAIERNLYYSGSLYDVPLVASMAWTTGIGLLALDACPSQQPASRSSTHGVWVARLGMIAIFSLPMFAFWSAFNSLAPAKIRTFRLVLTLGSMLVMGAMVFIRQHLLDRELLGLLNTSQEAFENLRRLQAQLVQSEKLASLGQLGGGAAHELNNPLTAMLGYSDLLAATSLNHEQRALAEKIGQQVRHTKSLIASLLSFAKHVPADKILLDLNVLVQTAVQLSRPQLRSRSIKVEMELAHDLPQLRADSNQLLQVCLHIINHVLHALAETGGVVTVRTCKQNDLVILEFSDESAGAQPPERILGSSSIQPVGQEMGLGLSACYGIIQEHKGKIVCQNRPTGATTLRIELPAASQASLRPGLQTGSSCDTDTPIAATLSTPGTN